MTEVEKLVLFISLGSTPSVASNSLFIRLQLPGFFRRERFLQRKYLVLGIKDDKIFINVLNFLSHQNNKCKLISRILKTPFDYLMIIHLHNISKPVLISGLCWVLIPHRYISTNPQSNLKQRQMIDDLWGHIDSLCCSASQEWSTASLLEMLSINFSLLYNSLIITY